MDKLKIRLEEALRIYKDSPTCNITYVDLARVYEDMLEIISHIKKAKMGFTNGENITN